MLWGTFFAALFAFITIYFENRRSIYVTSTQIPVLPYVLLFASIILINPVCRLVRFIKPLSVAEILVIFIMGTVSSGLSTFGLASQLVPVAGSLFNEYWNTDQSEWNVHVEPYINESFLLSVPGIQANARAYQRAMARLEEIQGDINIKYDPKYQHRIKALEKEAEQRKTTLQELEKEAFARVSLFRRGLPKGLRAYPGFIKLPNEDFSGYLARIQRLIQGRKALNRLRELQKYLSAGELREPTAENEANALVLAAIDALRPVSDASELAGRKEVIDDEWELKNIRLLDNAAEMKVLRKERRWAERKEFPRIDAQIKALREEAGKLDTKKRELELGKERVVNQLDAVTKVTEVITKLTGVSARLVVVPGPGLESEEMSEEVEGIIAEFPAFNASLKQFVIGDTPWHHWFRPLFTWGVLLGLTYIILMTFNVLIFRQWAHHERLIYPLAQLPEILAGFEGKQDGSLPRIFTSGLFWVGFSISALVMGWNALCYMDIFPGLNQIELTNVWTSYLAGSSFEGLQSGRCQIFFTMIGLAFLIPANISFSLWFFFVFYMVQVLLMVWLGYGQSEAAFGRDWWYTLNFASAESSGALIIFSLVILYKCRQYLLCFFKPASLHGLAPDEQRELRISSLLFIGCSIILILALSFWMGANIFHTIFFYFVILMLTISMVRAVAEGGLLGFQAFTGPLHFIRTMFGMDKSWAASSLFAPLMVYYSVFFLDLKAFIAPAMANAIKIRDDLRLKRGRFHLAILLSVGIAVVVSLGVHLMMAYNLGGDAMNEWFYSQYPQGMYNMIATMSQNPPVDISNNRLWIGFGALLMGALLYFRQFMFWIPHPIGLLMLVNPLMRNYWFSIFIAWLCKTMITKYGNRETYQRARDFFIGLIVGELIIIVIALLVTYVTEQPIPIDLNRHQ